MQKNNKHQGGENLFWTVRGVNRERRDLANRAARARGITLGHWLMEAVRHHVGTLEQTDPKEKTLAQLRSFDRSLMRLERAVRATILPRRLATDVDLQDLVSAYADVLRRRR